MKVTSDLGWELCLAWNLFKKDVWCAYKQTVYEWRKHMQIIRMDFAQLNNKVSFELLPLLNTLQVGDLLDSHSKLADHTKCEES